MLKTRQTFPNVDGNEKIQKLPEELKNDFKTLYKKCNKLTQEKNEIKDLLNKCKK